MKKAAVIAVILAIAFCFGWYIFDPGYEQGWIGHQSDELQAAMPAAEPSGNAAPSATEMENSFVPSEATASAITVSPSSSADDLGSAGWTLAWSDEFDAPFINMEYWSEMDRRDNFNGELQYYTADNSYIENDCLVLTAKEEEKEGKRYTSGMVQTCGKLEMRQGRIEASISLPVAQGIFPAFWLTTDSGKHELDILEMVGCEPGNIYGVCHYPSGSGLTKTYGMLHIENAEAFHTYALEWDWDSIRWYVDDTLYFSTRTGIPDEELYVLFTLAVGGEWPGSPDYTTSFPQSMRVDYIRLYSREAEGADDDTD